MLQKARILMPETGNLHSLLEKDGKTLCPFANYYYFCSTKPTNLHINLTTEHCSAHNNECIMSKKNNAKREAYKTKQAKKMEEQGKSVIRWIAITLAVLMVGLMGYFATVQ